MANEHQVSQRAQATWHGGKKRSYLFDTVEVDITHDLSINGVNTGIQHYRTWLHHIGSNALRLSHAHHENISTPGYAGEVLGIRVADRYRGVHTHQDKRRGLATDIAASNDHRMATCNRNTGILQNFEDDISSGRNETG